MFLLLQPSAGLYSIRQLRSILTKTYTLHGAQAVHLSNYDDIGLHLHLHLLVLFTYEYDDIGIIILICKKLQI